MKRIPILALLGAMPLAASAQSFSEDFDADHTSAWSYNSSRGAADGAMDNTGNEADFFFDYSTVGIPSANGAGGTTRGLKMEANVAGAVFSGMSASPLGKSFAGDYTLSFSAWQNVNGPFPAGGSGSTQFTIGGIGSGTTTAQFVGGTFNAVGFAASGDGNSATDYRAYTAPGAPVSVAGTYAAGSQNQSAAYYTSRYNGSVPAAQLALYPGQVGTPLSGALGMAWRQWEIKKAGTTVTWSVDGSLIATLNNVAPTGTNIFLGYFDSNATSSTDSNARNLLFGLVDNVRVTPVPEPASLCALALGAAAMLRRRRKA